MSRGDRNSSTVTEESEVETPEVTDDGTETPAAEGDSTEKAAKAAKEPARGDLDAGLVTPVQLARELSKPIDGNAENTDPSNFRYTSSKTGSHVVPPQMVYSYINNAGEKNPYPGKTVTDSLGKERANVVTTAEGLAWWDAKNARVAASKQAKAEKEAAKAAKAAKAASGESSTGESTEGAVEEAE
jgi:hypothetical protein